MKQFTVIGYYDDTGNAYSMPFKARDAYHAIELAALNSEDPDSFCIVGAIEGEHALTTPGEDNSATSYARDIIGEDDDAEMFPRDEPTDAIDAQPFNAMSPDNA